MSNLTRTQDGDRQHRIRNTRRLLWILVVASVGTIAFDVLFFAFGWFTNGSYAWQFLVVAGATALALALIPLAFRLIRRDRLDAAGHLILVGIGIVLISSELVLAGATLYLTIAGVCIFVLAGYVSLPRRYFTWLAAVILFLLLVASINLVGPLPRYVIGQSPATTIFVPTISLFIVVAMAWLAVRAFRLGTIRTRLLVTFILVVLVPAVVIIASSIIVGLSTGQQRVSAQLESVTSLKESEINTWLENLQFDLILALTGDEITQRAIVLLAEQDPSLYPIGHDVLQTRFQQVIREPGRFDELFLMNLEGQVLVSNDNAQEGKIYRDEAFFQQGILGPNVQPPFDFPALDQIMVVASRPVLNTQGDVIGVLAGRANLNELDRIMAERAGLGTTGETYLVDADHILLTRNRFGEQGILVHTVGANEAIDHRFSGSGTYNNYRATPVVASYRWVPELQVALLAEQEQAEAIRSVYTTLAIVAGVAFLSALLAVGISLMVTRGITTPIVDLADSASRVAAGDLKQSVQIEREDEIGTLAGAFNSMTTQLRDLVGGLEQRVADRTHELERRSTYLEAAAAVGRAAASILDTETLMNQVVELICRQFDLYYVGLFIVNEAGDTAELRASAGQSEQPLLALGLRLPVGPGSMIGWSITNRQVRVALEAEKDTERLVRPELPDTRSEAALPLISRGHVLGALSVQHTQPGFFDQDTVVVLQTMGDQVAVALANARLFAEREAALEASQRVYGELSREAWGKLLGEQPDLGFRSDERGTGPAGDAWRSEMVQALQTGQTVQGNSDGAQDRLSLAVPIRIRGEVVGVLDTYKPAEAGGWSREEVSLLEAVAAQLDTALESARLFQDTQRRAAREQAIRQITEQMRRAVDVEAILQITVAELAKAMGAPHAYVRLGTDLGAQAQPAANTGDKEPETDV
jgi:GAF domain-containing protein/HAMP domain-containing protein